MDVFLDNRDKSRAGRNQIDLVDLLGPLCVLLNHLRYLSTLG